jgi:hypothetical protein
MKTFFSASCLLLLTVFVVGKVAGAKLAARVDTVEEHKAYVSARYLYSITVPDGFRVDDSVPQLVSIESGHSRLRISAGCLEFGTEGLRQVIEPIEINAIPALKEDYYSSEALMLRRISLSDGNGDCFALEEVAETEQGWQELATIRKTFRFVKP